MTVPLVPAREPDSPIDRLRHFAAGRHRSRFRDTDQYTEAEDVPYGNQDHSRRSRGSKGGRSSRSDSVTEGASAASFQDVAVRCVSRYRLEDR